MDEVGRLLTLLVLLGGALTLVGAAFIWVLDEQRRIRRSLAGVLNASPEPVLLARGRGLGIGFNLTGGLVAVAWDRGAWCLKYRLDELMGVELIADHQVAARAFRGEARRPLDQMATPQERVRLRFVFDDPTHPDFPIDLWLPSDDGLRGRPDADEALQEANRWLARVEAMLRRSAARPPASRAAPAIAAQTLPATDHEEAEPPWDDDDAYEMTENP